MPRRTNLADRMSLIDVTLELHDSLDYELVCLPLRWRDAGAAPARAVLREIEPRGAG